VVGAAKLAMILSSSGVVSMWKPDVAVLAIIMIFGIPLAAVIGGCVISALKIVKGDPNERDRQTRDRETRLIQEIHHGLSRMEERVEALETLLLDREKKGDDK
jgi:hypothetical protein